MPNDAYPSLYIPTDIGPHNAALRYVDTLQALNGILHRNPNYTVEEYNQDVIILSASFTAYLTLKGLV